VVAALAAVTALAGCGSSGSTSTSSSDSASASATPAASSGSASSSSGTSGSGTTSTGEATSGAAGSSGAPSSGAPASGPAASGSAASGSAASGSAASGSAASGSAASGSAASSGAGPVSLKGVCPDTVSIQTDWNPESEHGGLYQMLGPNPSIDADKKRVSGPLYAGGKDTGITFEVRSGGPAIGFQTVTSQLYSDKKLTFGYANTDEAIQLSGKQPTVAVFAPLDKNPQMIMWDPATYPDVKTIADLKAKNTKVRYFSGAAYMAYLIGAGVLNESQTDGSYDGSPANFVAARGKDAQQGFASAEPYIYEHEVSAWKKPVAFQLVHDAGYPIYAAAYSVRAADLAPMTPCLKLLVPIFQQAQVDYIAKPAAVNGLILELVKQFNTGWQYSQGVADFAVKQQLDLGLVSNGTNATLGDFDMARIQKVIDIDTPIFVKQKTAPAEGLTPAKLATNEFIDMSIGLPKT